MDWGKFNLITAFEVFEHVPDVDRLMQDLSNLIHAEGLILFSTLLSDDQIQTNQRLSWWYASPRNGHISLFSRKSLTLLAKRYGFRLTSFNQNLHAMWKALPQWSSHIIRTSP
jgi:2-polyprenyl-3-methyl-5-hydroxy-6-metoxy-1,4-benzoquinol methylase